MQQNITAPVIISVDESHQLAARLTLWLHGDRLEQLAHARQILGGAEIFVAETNLHEMANLHQNTTTAEVESLRSPSIAGHLATLPIEHTRR